MAADATEAKCKFCSEVIDDANVSVDTYCGLCGMTIKICKAHEGIDMFGKAARGRFCCSAPDPLSWLRVNRVAR